MEKRFLIARWFGPDAQPIPIYDEASVSSARQRVREVAKELQTKTELVEYAALIASELGHNQLVHARQGYISVHGIERDDVKGIEVKAADIGPGIERPAQAIDDEIPTEKSLRAGLGAVCRIADEVEFDNRIREGLCVTARKFATPAPALCCEVAIMGRPFPGEIISGDDAVCDQSEVDLLAAVSDGLGHGPEAREASNQSVEFVRPRRQTDLGQMLIGLNDDLAPSRGCAMSIVRFRKADRLLECVSVGDVHAHIYDMRDAHFFTSTPLILGSRQFLTAKIRLETRTVAPGSVLVMFTDGLKSRTTLKGKLDILRQPAIAIAQHLLENDSRPDDDALVLVARFLR